jgi:hypothetical protein
MRNWSKVHTATKVPEGMENLDAERIGIESVSLTASSL